MSKLCIIITEKIKPSLRGELTRWMIELKTGVFIGTLSKLVRDLLWTKIQEKMDFGGALLLEPAANEQHFHIQTTGSFSRHLVNFDGLDLIRIPNQLKNNSLIDSIEGSALWSNEANKVPEGLLSKPHYINPLFQNQNQNQNQNQIQNQNYNLHQMPESFPKDFIFRTFTCSLEENHLKCNYHALSSYIEYPPESVWNLSFIQDGIKTSKAILQTAEKLRQMHPSSKNMKWGSVDLETTDYLPKAKQGFVNIIGLAKLNFPANPTVPITLQIYQTFNMKRSRKSAPLLLQPLYTHFQHLDQILVFNGDFDIPLLKMLAKELEIPALKWNHQIDLKKRFDRLEDLEIDLKLKGFPYRSESTKGEYSRYYTLFKGLPESGYEKQIEPIGTYNLMDVLSPLLSYLVEQISENTKK